MRFLPGNRVFQVGREQEDGLGVIVRVNPEQRTAQLCFATRGDTVDLSGLVLAPDGASPVEGFAVGALVVKNPANWKADDFDSWGRGEGVGVVAPSPFGAIAGEVDVVWPDGRCFERVDALLRASSDDAAA